MKISLSNTPRSWRGIVRDGVEVARIRRQPSLNWASGVKVGDGNGMR